LQAHVGHVCFGLFSFGFHPLPFVFPVGFFRRDVHKFPVKLDDVFGLRIQFKRGAMVQFADKDEVNVIVWHEARLTATDKLFNGI
jgi:hypothetical protein